MCDRATLPPPAVAPSPPRTWARTFPGRREHVRRARGFLAALLDGYPAADDAIMLVSELGANAVTHSASGQPGGTFTLRARIDHNGRVHAEVEDQGSQWNGDLSAAESPHGLYLLRALSADYGTRRGAHGWITWFTIDAPATGQAPQP